MSKEEPIQIQKEPKPAEPTPEPSKYEKAGKLLEQVLATAGIKTIPKGATIETLIESCEKFLEAEGE